MLREALPRESWANRGAHGGRPYNGAMRPDLLDLLACPLCKGALTLTVTDVEEAGGEILTGRLTCAACDEAYPIEDSIPNLLPPELRDQ